MPRVRWPPDLVDPPETLHARREALRRLQALVAAGRAAPPACAAARRAAAAPQLPQTPASVALCLHWATLLPATSLAELQRLLYRLHFGSAARDGWVAYEPPIAVDVSRIYARRPGEYRWWHVRLNYVVSYTVLAPAQRRERAAGLGLELRGLLRVLIASLGPEAQAERRWVAYDPEPLPLFLPGGAAALRAARALPCLVIESDLIWAACLRALRADNESHALMTEIIGEGLSSFF